MEPTRPAPSIAAIVALAAVLAGACSHHRSSPAAGAPVAAHAATIDLDLKDAPIHDALRAIAVAADVNLGVDPDVTGTVSIASFASTGAPIDLDLRDTPIRDVAGIFADVANLAVTVDDDVDALVTLQLRAVPWDLALDHLVRKYQLHIIRTDGQLRITRP